MLSMNEALSLPMDKLHRRGGRLLTETLTPGENVVAKINGVTNTQSLVLTDERVLIVKVGWTAGQTLGGKVTSFSYRNITSVEVRSSIISGVFEIAAGGVQGAERPAHGAKSTAWDVPNAIPISKRQVPIFQQAANVIRARSDQAAVAPKSATPDPIVQLQQLAQLRDQGILTDVEFEAKKVEILARI
jgi:hypothetical protein